ncbi:MAG: helix-turn-helix domain-containing protein [Brevibacterium sp.]|uniref:helix-turn-helix domain-containing protein n=1 Tax=Brevibacterium sp. TaxID=1701 RepID=UPI003F91F393
MSENPDSNLAQLLEFNQADRMTKSLSVSGVSVQAMADTLGVSRNTVSNWINGRTQPQRRTDLATWAMRTGVPIEWIETGELKNPPEPGGPRGDDGCATRDSNPQPSDP